MADWFGLSAERLNNPPYWQLFKQPEEDQYNWSKRRFKDILTLEDPRNNSKLLIFTKMRWKFQEYDTCKTF